MRSTGTPLEGSFLLKLEQPSTVTFDVLELGDDLGEQDGDDREPTNDPRLRGL